MDNFHDKIAKLCLHHFKTLPKTGKPKEGEWTVLSCIVLERDANFEVISLGTGSKCIGQTKLSRNGDILNDSHAEIICRRSLLRYLYEQINKSVNNSSEIYEYDPSNKQFKIKNIKFHFFTTHVPCGDAAIFPKQSIEDFGNIISKSNTQSKSKVEVCSAGDKRSSNTELDAESEPKKLKLIDDVYRTGAKCLPESEIQDQKLEGTSYHEVSAVRTKPGRGDPTLSVSCSDKISRWCHLGLQGSLIFWLTNLPIYLSSITIVGGTQFCQAALERALYDRIKRIELNKPFVQVKPIIGQSNLNFDFAKTDFKLACPSSISWVKTSNRPLEVAVEGKKQGVTKKKINTPAGRLLISKLELFKIFLDVAVKLEKSLGINKLNYKNAKVLSKEYENASNNFKNSLSVWSRKSDTFLDFFCE